jgi:dTDP-4-amino-4,6-dideoxygalactose transaminase
MASVASLKSSCGCSELEEMFEIVAMKGTRKVTYRELLKDLAQYSIFTDQEYEIVSNWRCYSIVLIITMLGPLL